MSARGGRRSIAVLGGTSAFGPGLAAALADRAADLPPLDVRLFGRDPRRAATVAAFSERHARARGADHRYRGTTDLAQAATGAAIVVNSVRAGGFAGRHRDETFPLAFGLPGDETVGPGGLAAALRAVPVALDLARRTAALARGAWFVNLANPMGILLAALAGVPGLRTFGLCELPGDTLARALSLLGELPARVEADYFGINHQGFFTRIERGGEDLLPRVFQAIEALPAPNFFRVDTGAMRALGALPLPYWRLYAHTQREAAALAARRESRARELARLADELFAAYAEDRTGALPPGLARREQPWYAQALVPALVAVLGGPPAELYVSQANGGLLPELPDAAVIETRARVTAGGIEPVAPRARPAHLAALLSGIAEFERRAAAAALSPSVAAVAAALAAHPLCAGRAPVEIDALARATCADDVQDGAAA